MRILIRRFRGRKKHPNWTGIAKEMGRTMDATVKPRLVKWAERTVANWEHKPEFKAMKRITREDTRVYVYPAGPNKKYWIWTSRGTPEHDIEPKNAPVLAFPSIYIPKTSIGPTYGGPGEGRGPTIFTMHVDHPGTTPRHFEEAWAIWARDWFRREMENAARRGARRA